MLQLHICNPSSIQGYMMIGHTGFSLTCQCILCFVCFSSNNTTLLFCHCLECVCRKHNCEVLVFGAILMYMQLPCQLIDCVVYGMLCIVRVLYCTLNSLQLSLLALCIVCIVCIVYRLHCLHTECVYIIHIFFSSSTDEWLLFTC